MMTDPLPRPVSRLSRPLLHAPGWVQWAVIVMAVLWAIGTVLRIADMQHRQAMIEARGGADTAIMEQAAAPPTSACAVRVYYEGENGMAWGSFSPLPGGGWATADHVLTGEAPVTGPDAKPVIRLEATDFAVLGGTPPGGDLAPWRDYPDITTGRYTIEGFPARAEAPVTIQGAYHTWDNIPPGEWIILDRGQEPAIGGMSGGCVRDESGQLVAITQGTASMPLNGERRHFVRIIPLRAGAYEHQTGAVYRRDRPIAAVPRTVPIADARFGAREPITR